jgi:predicted MFS family arabinose efflux permease
MSCSRWGARLRVCARQCHPDRRPRLVRTGRGARIAGVARDRVANLPDDAERARAIGIWASCNGLAWLVGPAIGGLIVDHVGWRGIFLVTVPFGALACVLAWKVIAQAGRRAT